MGVARNLKEIRPCADSRVTLDITKFIVNVFKYLPSAGTHHLRSSFASRAFNPVAVDSFQFLVEANFHLGMSYLLKTTKIIESCMNLTSLM